MYHILSELKLRIIFLAVYFVNTNPPEERIQVLPPEKELSELSEVIAQTFFKNVILIAIWKDQVQHSAIENTVYN